MSLTEVSLFAGVGGITLAAERAGMPTALVCEKDDRCRTVLAERFPNATIHDDVTRLTADDLRRAGAVPDRTVVSAGWPCQGNSVAGNRGGMADPRSGLWAHVARLLGEFRPRWFVGENVPGLLSVNGGRDFATVLQDLAELGYGFCWRVLDARHFGVPQRRRRVILVGHLGDAGAASAQVLLEPEGVRGDPAPSREPRSRTAGAARAGAADGGWVSDLAPTLESGANETGGVRPPGTTVDTAESLVVAFHVTQDPISGDVAPAMGTGNAQGCATIGVAYAAQHVGSLMAGSDGRGWRIGADEAAGGQLVADGVIVRRLTPLECERLQGFPDGWTDVPGTSDSQRYRQMGNAVAVPVLEWVMRRVAAVNAQLIEAAA